MKRSHCWGGSVDDDAGCAASANAPCRGLFLGRPTIGAGRIDAGTASGASFAVSGASLVSVGSLAVVKRWRFFVVRWMQGPESMRRSSDMCGGAALADDASYTGAATYVEGRGGVVVEGGIAATRNAEDLVGVERCCTPGLLLDSKYALCCRSTLLPLRSVTRFFAPPIQCLFKIGRAHV